MFRQRLSKPCVIPAATRPTSDALRLACPWVRTMGRLFGIVLAIAAAGCGGGTSQSVGVAIDANDIGGVVTGPSGPEAGVWVIAETDDLQTKFRKIVVTNDAGQFVLPELPQANYSVWVRGYGLKDSARSQAKPGSTLSLTAVRAADGREAAQVYPSNYWFSLIESPAPSEFPGTGPSGNGISPKFKTQAAWNDQMKFCIYCHQLGDKVTREVPSLEKFGSSEAAWDHRVQIGQRGGTMNRNFNLLGRERGLKVFANWTDRIAAGEYPTEAPPRPRGVERGLVLTMWDWGTDKDYVHDITSTDKRKPTVNANGEIHGVVYLSDQLAIADPIKNTSRNIPVPSRDVLTSREDGEFPPSPYWGQEALWHNVTSPHNPMMDGKGRIWISSTIRGPKGPDFCKEGSNHPSARYFPRASTPGQQISIYDPETNEWAFLDTCFPTHHLQFAEDRDDSLFFSSHQRGPTLVGWINTRVWDETHDDAKSQAWCPVVIDTSGDGKITKPWNEPGKPAVPGRDTLVSRRHYGVISNPTDGSVWLASDLYPGDLTRLYRGDNPPETCIAETYRVPSAEQPGTDPNQRGFSPRGIDIDRDGVIWTALVSGQMASFDRRKCKILNGPQATGAHCPEGWTFYQTPGPKIKGVADAGSADFHHYNWVDQFNTLGLGENIPIATGNSSDSLLALKPDTGEWVVLRVPYPMGFMPRGMDGRIDDPNAGWKGRGLWATTGIAAPWHLETGKGARPSIVHFQLRTDPLEH